LLPNYFIDIHEKLATATFHAVTIDIIYFDTIVYSSYMTRGFGLKEFNNRFNGGRKTRHLLSSIYRDYRL